MFTHDTRKKILIQKNVSVVPKIGEQSMSSDQSDCQWRPVMADEGIGGLNFVLSQYTKVFSVIEVKYHGGYSMLKVFWESDSSSSTCDP